MFEDGSCIEFSVEDERKALLHQYRNLWRREMKDKKGKNRTRRLRRLKRHGLGNPNVLFPKDQQPDNFRIIFRIFV
jgi:hypothetical protein